MHDSGDLLRAIRASAGITQERLAVLMGVSKVLIAKIENGDRELHRSSAKKLAKVLGCSPICIYPASFACKERPKGIEGKFYDICCKLQERLVSKLAKNLTLKT